MMEFRFFVFSVSSLYFITQISIANNENNCCTRELATEFKGEWLWVNNGEILNFTMSVEECDADNGTLYEFETIDDLNSIDKKMCLDDINGYYVRNNSVSATSGSESYRNVSLSDNSNRDNMCLMYNDGQLVTHDCSMEANVICKKVLTTKSQITPKTNISDPFVNLLLDVLSKVKNDTERLQNCSAAYGDISTISYNVTESLSTSSDFTSADKEMSTFSHDVMATMSTSGDFTSTDVISTSDDHIKNSNNGRNPILDIPVENLVLETVNQEATTLQSNFNSSRDNISAVTEVLVHLSKVKVTNIQTVQLFSTIVTEVLTSYNDSTESTTSVTQTTVFSNVLLSMENVVESSNLDNDLELTTKELDMSSKLISSNNSGTEKTTNHVTIDNPIGFVVFPIQIFFGQTIRVSTIVYNNIHKKMAVKRKYDNAHAQLGSNVVSVSLQRLKGNKTERLKIDNIKNVCEIVLPTDVNGPEKKRYCTFWNYDGGTWDTNGGKVKKKNGTHTTCLYDHLTNLAVLVLYYDDDVVDNKGEQVLMILTSIGCSLSIACLGMTLAIYVYLRVLSNEKILIHANLAVSLLLAQLVVVASQGAEKYATACKVVALMLHFFFMSAFTWMLMEGTALYLACTKGLNNYGDMRLRYCLIGWGLPLIIVLVSFGTEFQDYGHGADNSCWLSTKNGLIWAFMGPMLVIVSLNVFVLGLVMKVFLTLKAISKRSEAAKIRASLKTLMTLLPLLGITWLLSVLVPVSSVFHYLFVIGNSMQGMMIFFLHCACNEEVRKKFMEKRRRFSSTGRSTSETELSGMNHRRPLPRIAEILLMRLKTPAYSLMQRDFKS